MESRLFETERYTLMKELTVIQNNQTFSLSYEETDTVLRVLQRNGFSFRASCGGKGRCNHCLVLADGVKKRACRLWARDCQTITILPDTLDTKVEVLSSSASGESVSAQEGFGIAVDIGTTTIALALVRLLDGSILASHGFMNPGIVYGSDVLSRIDASNNGCLLEIKDSLTACLGREITAFLKQNRQIEPSYLHSICIAANTTMCHLLLGLSCETLGKFPFQPVMLSYPVLTAKELLGDTFSNATKVTILPGLSAFLGGDITSGLFSLQLREDDSSFLFVDMGTNGEMVLGNRNGLWGTSVAAGPAFEGSRVPGSDVLSAIYEMLQRKALDATGLLQGIFFYGGYRYQEHSFSQEDIRSVQLAKASVRAGIETLLHTAGIAADDISTVYLCGGFGTHTDVDKAISIGMFPEAFLGRIHPMGNTSLAGAVRYLLEPSDAYFIQLQEQTEIVELSSSGIYQENYVRWMNFLFRHK